MDLPDPGSREYLAIRAQAGRLWSKWKHRLRELQAPVEELDIEQAILMAWHSSSTPIESAAAFSSTIGDRYCIDAWRKWGGDGSFMLLPLEEGACPAGVATSEVESGECEPELSAKETLELAGLCTQTERLFFLLRNIPRYGEDPEYVAACAQGLARANEIPEAFALEELSRVVAQERARQRLRPGLRYGTLSSKAIQALFLPTHRPGIRAINTAKCRALNRLFPTREKRRRPPRRRRSM